jgi:tetratricopeptide (TPR) repeat protein
MRKIFITVFLCLILPAFAAAPPRGDARLRELVVFPEMNLSFNFGLSFQGNEWVVSKNVDLPSEISCLREELKQQPNDIKRLLRLGNLLDSNGQTNESQSCYQKIEQFCRNKASVNPQDGLNLTDLGEALWQLDKNEEAESAYRKATLVSSNEWRCWVRRGNFLANEYFVLLFPRNLRDQVFPSASQMPSQKVLDFRPSPDALKTSEARCDEASRCFDRAMALAPKEPEVFFQRAGYMSISNWQNCFFRYYRDNGKIDSTTWFSAFFSKETIANLQNAADLSPKNCDYISLAAYFTWLNAMIQAKVTNYTPDILSDAARKSIHNTMIRLENLSEGSDKKTAVGALENHGILNAMFGNSQEATVDFRRAASLDPTREQSWDMWLGTLVKSAAPGELVAICESHLKYKDSARNHLLLAKAFQRQKTWDRAIEQAEIAGKLETNNIVPPLMLATIALKQSADTNQLSMAIKHLNYANDLLKKMPANDDTRTRWHELMLNSAIACGLEGTQNGQKLARSYLEAVLKSYPDDEDAREIMRALE